MVCRCRYIQECESYSKKRALYPSDGIFVTTPQVGNRSMVNVVCEVKNAGTGVKGVTVKHEVVYDGKTIASVSDDFVA